MKFMIGDKIIMFNMKFNVVDSKKVQVGLNSGKAFNGSHFLLLDYDEIYPDEFRDVVFKEGIFKGVDYKPLRRGLIMESSPNHYHALSFSPLYYGTMLAITSACRQCHIRHKESTINNGFATLRFTPKKGFKIRMIEEINNKEGDNFYSFDHEEAYLKRLIKNG